MEAAMPVENFQKASLAETTISAEESVDTALQRLENAGFPPDRLTLFNTPAIHGRLVRMSERNLNKDPQEKTNSASSESSIENAVRIKQNANLLAKGWNSSTEYIKKTFRDRVIKAKLAQQNPGTQAKDIVLPETTVQDPEALADLTANATMLTDLGKTGLQIGEDDIVALIYLGKEFTNGSRSLPLSEALAKAGRALTNEQKQYLLDKLNFDPDQITLGTAFTLMHVRAADTALIKNADLELSDFGFEIELALCHHLSAGVYSENISPDRDFTPTTLHLISFLEVFDKYQAFLERFRTREGKKLTPRQARQMTLARIQSDYTKYISSDKKLKRVLDTNHYLERCELWLDFLHQHRKEFLN